MQSNDCAKYWKICANIGLIHAKQEKNGTTFMYMYQFHNIFLVSHVFNVIFKVWFRPKKFNQSILIAHIFLLLESLPTPSIRVVKRGFHVHVPQGENSLTLLANRGGGRRNRPSHSISNRNFCCLSCIIAMVQQN